MKSFDSFSSTIFKNNNQSLLLSDENHFPCGCILFYQAMDLDGLAFHKLALLVGWKRVARVEMLSTLDPKNKMYCKIIFQKAFCRKSWNFASSFN